jgi:hypothetical protein
MKLTDTQAVILNKAAQREDGLVQPPDTLAMPAAAKNSVAKSLVGRGLVEPVPAPASQSGFRWDGPGAALRIAPAGLEAIGVDPSEWPEYCRPGAPPQEAEEAGEAPAAAQPEEAVSIFDPGFTAKTKDAVWPDGPPKRGKRKAAEEAAARGELPAPPDFSADTHKPYRAKLARLVALAAAGDVAGLRAMAINPTSTSPRALARYRDLAVAALEAQATP